MDKKMFIEELIATERAFSKMSVEKGIAEAFIHFSAEEVILLRQNSEPIIGKETLKIAYQNSAGTLKWEPFKADGAESMDIGYTIGDYEYMDTNPRGKITRKGNYITIWKRQADGSLKFVLDTGQQKPLK